MAQIAKPTGEACRRTVIERVRPSVNDGRYPAKRVVGQTVVVQADIMSDGHDSVRAVLQYRVAGARKWREVPIVADVNDRWRAEFRVEQVGEYQFAIEAWVDEFLTWQRALVKRHAVGQDLRVEFQAGAALLDEAAQRAGGNDGAQLRQIAHRLASAESLDEKVAAATGTEVSELMQRHADRSKATRTEQEYRVLVERRRALFSTWYELFPRSCGTGGHGTFADCAAELPRIASMGFDVLYLPPIHPIGRVNRKGSNNAPTAHKGDPGSPWAIGSSEGGHTAVSPALGTLDDFRTLLAAATEHGMEVAIDIAFQCAPDHPYVAEHPSWFRHRPDGTIQYAENPPKKYEDVVPFDFECREWRGLWEELARVVLYWAEVGVRVFRVDNPHTKPFAFWEYLIGVVTKQYPDALFLAEAFTRPKVMHRLAKVGFAQSYTYFTWRNTRDELVNYMQELSRSDIREFFRPNFWPNTPDILPEYLQYGGRAAFIIRAVLAATLSSNYGIYGPVYELCVSEGLPDREEYADSEKYEVRRWAKEDPASIAEVLTVLNAARRENAALQETYNLTFLNTDNERLIAYLKVSADDTNTMLVVVNLDPHLAQAGWVDSPGRLLGVDTTQPFLVYDLLSQDKYVWQGNRNYVELDPASMPAHVFRVHRRLRREADFDYYL